MVLFLKNRICFCYVPENEIEGDTLVWTTSIIDPAYTAFMGSDIVAADIQNVYRTVPNTEKFYIVYSPEFGYDNIGKTAIVKQDFYGTKSSEKYFRNHICNIMDNLV